MGFSEVRSEKAGGQGLISVVHVEGMEFLKASPTIPCNF